MSLTKWRTGWARGFRRAEAQARKQEGAAILAEGLLDTLLRNVTWARKLLRDAGVIVYVAGPRRELRTLRQAAAAARRRLGKKIKRVAAQAARFEAAP